jgi:hypothetical membrane protein
MQSPALHIERGVTMSQSTFQPNLSTESKGFPRHRAAGALLVEGPAIFLLTEFIAAAAWTNPPYSYTYNFISNLGVEGPSTLFGQYMHSPLYWVMNAGFFLFGLVMLAGVTALPGLSGWRRWVTLVPATALAVGGVLLALFPGSGEALEDGTGQYHSMGAFLGFIGGNVLAIMLGKMRHRLGLSIGTGRALVTVGIIGLISTVLYLTAIVLSEGDSTIGIVGLIERGATHPFLISTLCAGASLLRRTKNRPLPERT